MKIRETEACLRSKTTELKWKGEAEGAKIREEERQGTVEEDQPTQKLQKWQIAHSGFWYMRWPFLPFFLMKLLPHPSLFQVYESGSCVPCSPSLAPPVTYVFKSFSKKWHHLEKHSSTSRRNKGQLVFWFLREPTDESLPSSHTIALYYGQGHVILWLQGAT